MRWISLFIGANIFALALLVLSAVLALNNKSGWGWPLALSVLCAYGPKTDKANKNSSEEGNQEE